MITIPLDFATAALAYTGELTTDLMPIILLVVGVPLGFYVVRKVVALAKLR